MHEHPHALDTRPLGHLKWPNFDPPLENTIEFADRTHSKNHWSLYGMNVEYHSHVSACSFLKPELGD